MTQKRMKSVRGTLASREAPKISNANTTKANQISDSKNFNLSRCQQKKKKKSNADTTKANRISDSKKFNLSRCQQQMKKEKKSVDTCKDKSLDIVAHSQESILCQQDLMREILSWLPVRSLFRFKCVAKSLDLTSDPYFRLKHQSHHDVSSLRFLLLHINNTKNTKDMSFHNLYSTSSLSSPDDVQKIDSLSSDNNRWFHLLCGSCDGLVLIELITSATHKLLLLLNPSTRESIQLPFPIFGIKDSTFGLGYDPTTHDYKILTIHTHKSQTKCAILALKSGSWRNVYIDTPHIFRTSLNMFRSENPLAFLHGAFHWIPCSLCVVSFNISNEVYTKIPLSEQMHSYFSLAVFGDYHISVLDGMLCFSSACEVDGAKNIILWAMKDYGVKESWTRLFKIKVAQICVVKPIYRFADGDVLIHCRDKRRDSVRSSKGLFRLWSDSLVQRPNMVDIITFKESLINPKLLI